MNKIVTLATIILALSFVFTGVPLHLPSVTANSVIVDNRLSQVLSTSSSTTRIYAVAGFNHPPTSTDVANMRSLGLTVLPYQTLPFAALAGTKDQVASVVNVAGVTSIYWNRPIYPFSTPDPDAIARDTNAYGTGATTVGADRAWRLGIAGQGITVAVIDTGIDTTNPSLAFAPNGPVIQNVRPLSDEYLLYPDRSVTLYLENQISTDTFGHGTHVAGSVAGSGAASNGFYTGIAPGANLVGLNGLQCSITDEAGLGCLVTILSSFDWVVNNQDKYHIRVETNSWGDNPGPFDPNDPISISVHLLTQNNITVLFAAGNAGPDPDTMSPESRNSEVIAVAAGQPSGGLVDFSSRGVPGGVTPTIASPGHLIISSRIHTGGDMDIFTVEGTDAILPTQYISQYLVAQGTSMATPIAAGTVALILSANPALSPPQAKQLVQSTATPMLGYQPFQVGAGFINAEAGVRNALGRPAKVSQVKLPASVTQGTDQSTNSVTLSYPYRASITGLGIVGFGHFPFSFPVYTNDLKPIDVVLSWTTIQPYSVYTTGYEVQVFDPQLNIIQDIFTDFFTLSTGLTITIDSATRAQHTPATGAYWYMTFFNFNPGFGILDMTAKAYYPSGFKPPTKTQTLPPVRISSHTDKAAVSPGSGVQVMGSLTDVNGDGVDGYPVKILLSNAVATIWSGSVNTVDGYFTTFAPVPKGTIDGAYSLIVTASTLSTGQTVTVDSAPTILSSFSLIQTSPRSFLVQASAVDNTGLGYVAAFASNSNTGSSAGVFLARGLNGGYSGTLTFPDSATSVTWQISLYTVDLATNKVSATTTLVL